MTDALDPEGAARPGGAGGTCSCGLFCNISADIAEYDQAQLNEFYRPTARIFDSADRKKLLTKKENSILKKSQKTSPAPQSPYLHILNRGSSFLFLLGRRPAGFPPPSLAPFPS